MRQILSLPYILLCALAANNAVAQTPELPPVLGITLADIRQATIAFVNGNTIPGVQGADLHIQTDDRQGTHLRSSLGFGADVTLPNSTVGLFWGGALISGTLEESHWFTDDSVPIARLDVDREISGLRAAAGVFAPWNRWSRFRLYYSAVYSELNTQSGLLMYESLPQEVINDLDAIFFTSDVTSLSSSLTAQLEWFHYWGEAKWEVDAKYSSIYTDTRSETSQHLDTWAWSDVAQAELSVTVPSRFRPFSQALQVQMYTQYSDFLGLPKAALGYTYYFETGLIAEWEVNLKPLDLFGLRMVGLKAGYIAGDDVTGYSVGLVLK